MFYTNKNLVSGGKKGNVSFVLGDLNHTFENH